MKNIEASDRKIGNPGKSFSIVFPTRERPYLLGSLLSSLRENTFDLDELEVLIAIDNDDKTDYKFLEAYDFVQQFRVQQSLNFSEDYYNFLAKKSTGQWIITANDDCRFETKNWDKITYDMLKDQSQVIYGWIEDGLGKHRARGQGDYCCFPLQGRRGYEALGFIFPSRIPTWGADIWAGYIYRQINSFVRIPIKIQHYCHHNMTRVQDHISKRISSNQVIYSTRPTREEVEALLNALNRPKEEIDSLIRSIDGPPKFSTWNPANSFKNPHKRRLIMNS